MVAPAQKSSVVQTVQIAGGTLFAMALQYLGDATQWDRIAALNGFSDPWLAGVNDVEIPPYNPAASGNVVIPGQS